jgi:putative SOS response-associated peptidase YedK
LEPRFNICPTATVDVVIFGDGKRTLVPMRWGLIPGRWQKSVNEMRLATFNARAKTIAEKPMFRYSFNRRRCLMPVSGYYEWESTPDGKSHIEPLMGKLFELTLDLGFVRLIWALFAYRSRCAVVVVPW